MGPSGQAVTEFCNALPTSDFRSVSEGETVKQRNTSQSQHRSCGNNGEEEEDAVAGTHSKNGCRMHTQETAGMQVGSGQASSQGRNMKWADIGHTRTQRDTRLTKIGEK